MPTQRVKHLFKNASEPAYPGRVTTPRRLSAARSELSARPCTLGRSPRYSFGRSTRSRVGTSLELKEEALQMTPSVNRFLVAAAAAAAVFAAPVTVARADNFPLISAQVPLVTANHYAFDLVVHQHQWDPAAAKAANPRAVWFMTGVGGATYAQEISDTPGF